MTEPRESSDWQYTEEQAHGPLIVGLAITDEMAARAWDAYCQARDDGEDEPVVVMRAALEAAFADPGHFERGSDD